MEPKVAVTVLLQLAYESALGSDFLRLEEAERAVWEALGRLEALERERDTLERRVHAAEARLHRLESTLSKATSLLIEALNLFRRGT